MVRSDGNVGIGTASPSQLLEVNGAAKVDGALTAASATISGNTSISGTLGAGATTITGNLSSSGNTSITGTLSAGATTLGATAITGNSSVTGNLTVSGTGNKLIFPDGTSFTTATAVHTVAACLANSGSDTTTVCGCNVRLISRQVATVPFGSCSVTSDTGSCGETAGSSASASCCVCSPN
jgi:cytoskeletal protein CcmA (bactofilin family)